jgi:predicted nucleic acid-binding protein
MIRRERSPRVTTPRILDSCVLIDVLRGRPAAVHLLVSIIESSDPAWSVAPVRTEILVGIRTAERPAFDRFASTIVWVPVHADLADDAAELAAPFIASHGGMDAVDMLLAALTVRSGGRLHTLNVRHFPMLPGLAPAY